MVVGDVAKYLDTVVIGSGPGGYVAAIRAAQLGKNVAIIERDAIGGVCLNVGCIPSKALINAGHRYRDAKSNTYGVSTPEAKLDFAETQRWKDEDVVSKLTSGIEMLLKKNKVQIIRGTAFFNDQNLIRVVNDEESQSYRFNEAIIATGSRPIEINGFKFKDRVIDSTGALNLAEVPKHLVVIGGGYIGSELASAYANLGSKVTIIQSREQILPGFDADMVKIVEDDFKARGVDIIVNARAKEAKQTAKDVEVFYEVDGKKSSVKADYVLVSVGRTPNTDDLGLVTAGVDVDDRGFILVDKVGRTSQDHIFAIGDVVAGHALAHKASYEGKVAAAVLAGKNAEVDYVAMPEVCFTDPELASVGLRHVDAVAEGIDAKVATFPFMASGRALSLDDTRGFLRLVYENESKLVIGAQAVGASASEIIAELGLAIEARMNLEDIVLTIHAHPTIAETIMDAAELALGMPIHI